MTKWTSQNMPPQRGRTAVITGTGGLGYEDALALARAGARVVLAGRNAGKGAEAVAAIQSAVPGAAVRFAMLDLADLASVADFAARLRQQEESLDLLINNAAVMNPPLRGETRDGFELQFGTNYLGHFALTAHLLPLLKKGDRPRVVTLSSIAARQGLIDFDNLQAERRYVPMQAYSQSKLACLIFALELSRRAVGGGWGIASIGAHPGITRTDLIVNGAGPKSLSGRVRRYIPGLFQPAWQGALPALYAATDPEARNGGYYGPNGLAGLRGYPTEETPPKRALDGDVARRLWEVSETLAGVSFAEISMAA